MQSQVIAKLEEIIARNRPKNNVLRKTFSLEVAQVHNAEINGDGKMKAADPALPVEIVVRGVSELKFLKFVYAASSNDSNGSVELSSDGTTIQVGPLNPYSTPYYWKLPQASHDIIIRIFSREPIDIQHMELISITYLEYKSFKLNQYRVKLSKLLDRQPHLRKRLIHELRTNGMKAAWSKTKAKLYQNEGSMNVITVDQSITAKRRVPSQGGVLVISHDAQKAGAPLLALNIAKTLKQVYKQNVHILLMQGGPNEKEYAQYGSLYNLNQASLSHVENERQLRELIQVIRDAGVDKCIANTVVSGALLRIIHEAGIKTVSLVHELPTSIKTYNFIEGANTASAYADKVVFPNTFVKEKFVENFSVDSAKIVIRSQGIYNKSHLEITKSEAKAQLCERLNIDQASKIVLNCGYADLRKGTDLFFALARELCVNEDMQDIHFVWLGDSDPIIRKWMEHDAEVLGIEKNIHFMGFVSEPQFVFAGADAFVLTSREDPFPTVVLEAIEHKTPVIAFEGAGGIPELLNKFGATSVPYNDTKRMAEELVSILAHPENYAMTAERGQKLVYEQYDHQNYVGDLLQLLDENTSAARKSLDAVRSKRFKVSVIVPNYNYEKFIEARLDTIIGQSYKPYEIIFLDDCSKDNSVAVARKRLSVSPIPYRIIENKNNVGCFGQWIKGIEEAEGDLIWIAEADDLCELDMLERLVGFFSDQEVNLAYGQSQIINENSEQVDWSYTQYTNDLSETKWLSEYIIEGREEIVHGLGIKNTIPNASAVLMRKSALSGLGRVLGDYKICGDWLAYVYILQQGKIAFCPDILNYHRRHSQSIISVKEQSSELYLELIRIKQFIVETFQIPAGMKERFLRHIETEYERLGCKGMESRLIKDNPLLRDPFDELITITETTIASYNYLQKRSKMLLVAPDLEVGGGQMLVVRLANHFVAFHDVYIYSARPWLSNAQILDMISPSVTIVPSTGDPAELQSFIVSEGIEIVNSHIWWSDKAAYQAVKNLDGVRWIIAMHGCYEALLDNPGIDCEFESLVGKMFKRANHIIYATDKNRKIFGKIKTQEDKLHKIYYGYALQSIPPKSRGQFGISADDFVFGLVSRAIKEKGWEESIAAAISLKARYDRLHLILVGAGAYADQLKEQYSHLSYIHFVNSFTEPSEWIGWVKVFDVGLLPSYFVSESLPNTVIEYLAYDKPVIATDIGDIKYMLTNGSAEAGYVLQLEPDRTVDPDKLADYMEQMMKQPDVLASFQKQVPILFEQFKMENFASAYYQLFFEPSYGEKIGVSVSS